MLHLPIKLLKLLKIIILEKKESLERFRFKLKEETHVSTINLEILKLVLQTHPALPWNEIILPVLN